MKNCKLNTCSELVNSTCVLFTGELITDSYINLDGCDITLDEVISEIDRLIEGIKDNENILISDINSHNCSLSRITDLLSDTANLDGLKVKTSKTILTLLDIICDQKAEIDALKNGGIYDLPLTDEILANLKCFAGIMDDPCGGVIQVKTLKDLLLKLVSKVCECCP